MDRIAIIGCGGGGKSHLARELGASLGITPVHLDTVYYDKDWNPLPKDQFAALQRDLVSAPRWVIDGNYASSLPIRLAAADTVIFLDLPARACWGIAQRRPSLPRRCHRRPAGRGAVRLTPEPRQVRGRQNAGARDDRPGWPVHRSDSRSRAAVRLGGQRVGQLLLARPVDRAGAPLDRVAYRHVQVVPVGVLHERPSPSAVTTAAPAPWPGRCCQAA